jgi:hypothetical protein
VSDIARVLLTAAVLSASALSAFAWRLTRLDVRDPVRVVGELHLAQWAALLLAIIGAVPIGLAVARETVTAGTLDVSIGLAFILLAGYVQRREPRDALLLAAVGFVVHALTDIAHRPGWLATELTPRWYVVGCAVYDVYLAALCYWARRRG